MEEIFVDVLENWGAPCSQLIYYILLNGQPLGLTTIQEDEYENEEEWFDKMININIMKLSGLLMNMRGYNSTSKYFMEDSKLLSVDFNNTVDFLKNGFSISIARKLFTVCDKFKDYDEKNLDEYFFKHFNIAFPIVLFIMNNELLTRLTLFESIVDDEYFNLILDYMKLDY